MLSRQAQLGRRAARSAAGPLGLATAVALSAAAVAVLAGCGGDDEGGGGPPVTELTVTLDVDGDGGEAARTEEVSCSSGDAGDVCRAAAGLTPVDLTPVRPTQLCTEIFGGPEVATIEGELDGEQVEATFDRSNGCEIDRFGAIVPLLQALFPDYQPGESLGA